MVRYHHAPTDFTTYVDVVPEHEWQVIPQLLADSCDEQRWSHASVLRALDAFVEKVVRRPHLVTPKARQDFCDDVAIWWLYEFLAGRGLEHVIGDSDARHEIRGLGALPASGAPRNRPMRLRR